MKIGLRNINWLKVFVGLGIILMLSAYCIANQYLQDVKISKLEFNIEQEDIDPIEFVTREQVLTELEGEFGTLVGKKISEINTELLEKRLLDNPYVSEAKVFSLLTGELCIQMNQKRPIARIKTRSGFEYYLDEKGFYMPLSDKFTARVPLVTGDINLIPYKNFKANALPSKEILSDTVQALLKPIKTSRFIDSLYTFLSIVYKDSLNRALVQQIEIQPNHELVIVPTIGDQHIEFGKIELVEDKFLRLWTFYNVGLSRYGWKTYSNINLKYERQVVCTKTITHE